MSDVTKAACESDVTKAAREISTGKDTNQETMLLLEPYINWQNFLVPAPITIAILGQLILNSSTTDFTLENTQPKGGFVYIKWPRSFRATVAQVTHSGYDALNVAQRNMNKIRLYSAKLPEQLKKIGAILMKGNNEEIKRILPIPLKTVAKQAEDCVDLANSVEKEFFLVRKLTSELLEACVCSQSDYANKAKDTKVAILQAKISQKEAETQKNLANSQFSELQEAVKEAEKRYFQAVDSMPGGMKMVGMKVVDTVCSAFTNTVSSVITKLIFANPEATKEGENVLKCSNCLSEIHVFIDLLASSCFKDGDITWQAVKKNCNIVRNQIQKNLENAQKIDTDHSYKEKVNSLCKRTADVCDQLNKLCEQPQPENTKALKEKIDKLERESLELSIEASVRCGVPPSQTTAPQRAKCKPCSVESGGSVLESTIQNAWNKIQTTTAHLEYSKKQYDKACDRMNKKNEKLANIMKEMAKLDIDRVHFENIRETLYKGIKALGALEKQWHKIREFFALISNLINVALDESLQTFIKMSEAEAQLGFDVYPIASWRKDMLFHQLSEASKLAYFVNMISKTYVEISEVHITDPISRLGKLFGFDPEKDKSEINRQKQALVKKCESAQMAIKDLTAARQQEFDHLIDERIDKVRCTLEMALPAPTAKVKERTNIFKECVEKNLEKKEHLEEDSDQDIDDFM